jgi:hypothetical protein
MLKNRNSVTGVVLRGPSTEDALKVINLGKIREGSVDALRDGIQKVPGLKPDIVALPGILIGRELPRTWDSSSTNRSMSSPLPGSRRRWGSSRG